LNDSTLPLVTLTSEGVDPSGRISGTDEIGGKGVPEMACPKTFEDANSNVLIANKLNTDDVLVINISVTPKISAKPFCECLDHLPKQSHQFRY
jgi:hypothetical protein